MVYVSKLVWHIPLLCVRWKTPDDGQRNCPKHVLKPRSLVLVHPVGFIIRIYHDARSPELQIRTMVVPMNTHKNTEPWRKNTNKMQQYRWFIVSCRCWLLTTVSTCFGHLCPSSGEKTTCYCIWSVFAVTREDGDISRVVFYGDSVWFDKLGLLVRVCSRV